MRGSKNITERVGTSFVCGLLFGSLFVNSVTAVTLTGPDYAQNFDSLAGSGTTGTVLPLDWAISEVPTSTPLSYGVSTGSATTGNTYSFGAAGSTDRALGGLQSGSLLPMFGVHFENGGTTPIISLTISYTGEQWRLGALGRVDRLDFQFSTDATSLSTGNWIDVDALDFFAPVTTGTVGARDGNASANRTSITSTISGLSLAVGDSLWLRWTDFSATGADDGLGIDDFRLEATFRQPINPGPTSGVPDAGTSLALFGLSLTGLGLFARRRS